MWRILESPNLFSKPLAQFRRLTHAVPQPQRNVMQQGSATPLGSETGFCEYVEKEEGQQKMDFTFSCSVLVRVCLAWAILDLSLRSAVPDLIIRRPPVLLSTGLFPCRRQPNLLDPIMTGWTYNTPDDVPTDGPRITAVCLTFTIIALLLVCLRWYVRTTLVKAVGYGMWDRTRGMPGRGLSRRAKTDKANL